MEKTINLTTNDAGLIKAVRDPFTPDGYHLETLLPFSEANKLIPGNANVRTPKPSSRPYRKMIQTVEDSPRTFHQENRGIVFVCDSFNTDDGGNVTIHLNDTALAADGNRPKFGIADGGHTFAVIANTMEREADLKQIEDWTEPYVRIKFMTPAGVDIGRVVEALNTSTQVKDYTIDDYRSEFNPLKDALQEQGFDISEISWRENDNGYWDVRELLQRLACFLPNKPNIGPRLYKSRQSALRMYIENKEQFRPLFPLIRDLAFLPELIEAQFSSRENIKQRMRIGSLRVAKTLATEREFPSLGFSSKYLFDLAATLPIAGAFRELLSLDSGVATWEVDYQEALAVGAEDFYRALTDTLATTTANVSAIGYSLAYWAQCSNIALRVKGEMLKYSKAKVAQHA